MRYAVAFTEHSIKTGEVGIGLKIFTASNKEEALGMFLTDPRRTKFTGSSLLGAWRVININEAPDKESEGNE